jgi:integrase/recombinase XerD
MRERWDGRLSGPLAGYWVGFGEHLIDLGYAPVSVTAQRALFRDVSLWLDSRGLGVEALCTDEMDDFVVPRRRSGRPLHSQRALRPLIGYLGRLGVLSAAVIDRSPLQVLLGDYRRYLVEERSLAPLTVLGYMGTATRFGGECLGVSLDLVGGLGAGDVAVFMRRAGVGLKPKTVNEIAVGLRSFLRFLYSVELIDVPLWEAVLGMASWRAGSLPRTAPPGAAEAILASCDRRSLVGARDFAMIILIARLGLRAGEVAAVELDDVGWASGELVVRGKGGRRDVLPVPVDVGEAVAEYLCRRGPTANSRQVFLHVQAPGLAVAMTDVRAAVRRGCWRAGIADTGTHRFRHSLATGMLARGARLSEIGEILRHRDLETTALYAKVDRDALATVARPWPGSRP